MFSIFLDKLFIIFNFLNHVGESFIILNALNLFHKLFIIFNILQPFLRITYFRRL